MSIQAIAGPRLDVFGPPPRPPRYRLTALPDVIVEEDAFRALNGVNVQGYPEDPASVFEWCGEGTFATKGDTDDMPLSTFDPFVAYVPVQCITRGLLNLEEMAVAVLEATESFAIEGYLSHLSSSNPFFSDADMTAPAGTGAVDIETGIAWLENAIGATGRTGIIWLDPASAAAGGFDFFRECDPDGDENSGDEYLCTNIQTPVVVSGALEGIKPVGRPSPGAGQSWAYATGPVAVHRGPVSVQELPGALDRDINLVTFRAERNILAYWDTAVQAGVLIDWST